MRNLGFNMHVSIGFSIFKRAVRSFKTMNKSINSYRSISFIGLRLLGG